MKKIKFIFYLILGVYFLLLFMTQKYSLRLANYVIIPMGIYQIYRKKKYEKTGFEGYILCFIVALATSSIGAYDFRGIRDEVLDISTVFLVFLTTAQFPIKKIYTRYLVGFAILGFVYKISLSYLERVGYIEGLYNGIRISGGEEVWRYAPIIAFGVVMVLALLFFKRNNKKELGVLLVSLVLLIEILIRTQNRGNWVAVILCFCLMLVLKLRRKAIIPILTFVIILTAISKVYENNIYVRRLNTIVLEGDKYRVELWKASINIFEKNFINGVGYSPKNFVNSENLEFYRYLPKKPHGHSHNSLFYMLVTTGIIGAIAYILMSLKMLYYSFKNRKNDYSITFFMILSVQIFSCFETPVKYLDLMGMQMLMLGVLYNLVKTNEKIF